MSTLKSSAEDLTLNADGSGNDVIIQSDGSTKAIVTAEGTVGIGTDDPQDLIETSQSSSSKVFGLTVQNSLNTNSSATGIGIKFKGSSYSDADESRKYAAIYGVAEANYHNEMGLAFYTNDDRTQDPTEKMRILAGGGITFNGDTAAANALDDYEEGTWTPTGTNVVNAVGYYTKIGRFVYCSMWFSASGGDTTSTIGGLPFSSFSTNNAANGGAPIYSQNDIRGLLVSGGGGTTFHLYGGSSGNSSVVVADGQQMHAFLNYTTP